MDDATRAAAIKIGVRIFNAVPESRVAKLAAKVFPHRQPVAGLRSVELTICRLAIACAAIALDRDRLDPLHIGPVEAWQLLRPRTLAPLIEPYLTNPTDRARWEAMERSFLANAHEVMTDE